MTNRKCFRLPVELEELKRRFGITPRQLEQKLRAVDECEIDDAESLIRLHETLLFLRAYPLSPRVFNQVEKILKSFGQRVSHLRESGADLTPLDEVEVSGIAGTSVTSNFSHQIVRWLVAKYPSQVSIDWDWFEEDDRFGATMPRFLPLLEEDAMVEAHVPYRVWLRAAKGRRNDLGWIIERFESLKISHQAKAEFYDSLKLHVIWKFGVRASRTQMKLPARKIFFHRAPLIQRREVSLVKELASSPIPMERLSRAAGERILDLARETSAVRYRELLHAWRLSSCAQGCARPRHGNFRARGAAGKSPAPARLSRRLDFEEWRAGRVLRRTVDF